MHYFARKLELVSNILWVIVGCCRNLWRHFSFHWTVASYFLWGKSLADGSLAWHTQVLKCFPKFFWIVNIFLQLLLNIVCCLSFNIPLNYISLFLEVFVIYMQFRIVCKNFFLSLSLFLINPTMLLSNHDFVLTFMWISFIVLYHLWCIAEF